MRRDDSLSATRASIITIWCHIVVIGGIAVIYIWLIAGRITWRRR